MSWVGFWSLLFLPDPGDTRQKLGHCCWSTQRHYTTLAVVSPVHPTLICTSTHTVGGSYATRCGYVTWLLVEQTTVWTASTLERTRASDNRNCGPQHLSSDIPTPQCRVSELEGKSTYYHGLHDCWTVWLNVFATPSCLRRGKVGVDLDHTGDRGKGWLYIALQCHHENDSCESCFSVSYIVTDKVTRQCPQTTTFDERERESRSGIEPMSLWLPA